MSKGLLIAIVFCLSLFAQAQDTLVATKVQNAVLYEESTTVTPLTFEETLFEKYENNPHFDYTEVNPEDSWWFQFRRWLSQLWSKFWQWLFGDYQSNSFLVFLFKAIPYIILGGILIFMIWLFYRINPGSKLLVSKETPEVFYTDEEEIIKTKNIQDLIDQALSNKDYRLAVRFGFLLVLKRLSETEIISYEFDKTNSDYYNEIKKTTLLSLFKKVSKLYEYTWYGNFSVNEHDYAKASNQFAALHSEIKLEVE